MVRFEAHFANTRTKTILWRARTGGHWVDSNVARKGERDDACWPVSDLNV